MTKFTGIKSVGVQTPAPILEGLLGSLLILSPVGAIHLEQVPNPRQADGGWVSDTANILSAHPYSTIGIQRDWAAVWIALFPGYCALGLGNPQKGEKSPRHTVVSL